MGLNDYKEKLKSYETIIAELKNSQKSILKAILIEVAGVLDANGKICDDEKAWFVKLCDDLGFREFEANRIMRIVQDINDVLEEAYVFINSKR